MKDMFVEVFNSLKEIFDENSEFPIPTAIVLDKNCLIFSLNIMFSKQFD